MDKTAVATVFSAIPSNQGFRVRQVQRRTLAKIPLGVTLRKVFDLLRITEPARKHLNKAIAQADAIDLACEVDG